MYESKKNSGRKDIYKYQKSSHQKNFHNSTYFGYHKYNKYKQKYNHSNSIKDYDEETIFSQIFEGTKSTKKTDLKEIDNLTPTPTIKECKTLNDNKENFSINSNYINELNTEMKTSDIKDINEINKKDISENISSFNDNSSCNTLSENFIICEKENDNDNENKINEKLNNEINNITNITNITNLNNENNINFNNNANINNLNFNVENVINDLLTKNNECFFASNEKENIHLDYKKNVYKTPQPFKANSSPINLTSNDMKDAYYVPKKLSTIYDMYGTQQQPNIFDRRRNSFNNFNFMTIQKPTISLSNKQIPNYSNLGISNNNLNYFKNNNNNFLHFNNGNNNMSMNSSFNIPSSPNIPINSFNVFESNNINNIGNIGNINNLQNIQKCLTHNNHHNLNKNPFHNMMPQLELNKCILKTQINNNNLFEKDKENTDILEIYVKISKTETLTFKIRRYDDMFKTVKMFCEINKLDIKLIRPFIVYIIRALNSIYGIYNLNLKSDEIQFIKDIKDNFYKDVEEENNTVNKDEKGDDNNNNDGSGDNVEKTGIIFSDSKENCDDEEEEDDDPDEDD